MKLLAAFLLGSVAALAAGVYVVWAGVRHAGRIA